MRKSLLSLSIVTSLAFAQHPVVVPPDNLAPNLNRCGTRLSAPLIGVDHPDCDFFNTNPLAIYAPSNVLRIPVVVHVISNTAGQGNLSDALVQSQITVLNEDFRAMAGTPGAFGVDTRIEFYLATTDPAGNPSTGIRRYTNNSWFSDNVDYWTSTSWNTQRYLNIYTNSAQGPGPGTLGYTALPQSSPGWLNTPADRVVILWSAFGRPALGGAPYNAGRSCTHEVGHYVGLFHPFDFGCDAGSCYTSGDRICDTASDDVPHGGCPVGAISCGVSAPIRNYMEYTNDACMTHFTQEQARRMRCTLQHYRPTVTQPIGPLASSTVRNGAGNLNGNYACTAPRLGTVCTAQAVTFGTGFSLATVFGYIAEATVAFPPYTILVDINSPQVFQLPFLAGTIAVSWPFNVPNDPGLAGLPIKTQAVLLGATFALTNAVDLVVGF